MFMVFKIADLWWYWT